ncbi:helix-turn-helix domain-containing protein [Streptomyces sp. NPDC054842]
MSPEEAGLPTGAGPRRTPGLRLEELATLARISVDYYARLERGAETRPGPSVIDALAAAPRLGDTELEHPRSLAARAAGTAPTPSRAPGRRVRLGTKLLLDSLRPNPAHVISRTGDLLASTRSYCPRGGRCPSCRQAGRGVTSRQYHQHSFYGPL